jgi:hypothetical protein
MFLKWTIHNVVYTALSLTVGTFAISCSNKNATRKDMELLTGSPWKYEKAGFDDDDGTFDALDPRIAGSERDNSIIFCKDGTGYSELSHKSKNSNPDSLPFIWAFQNNDSVIYFQDQYYKVRVLSHDRLELYSDQHFGGVNTRYTVILTR